MMPNTITNIGVEAFYINDNQNSSPNALDLSYCNQLKLIKSNAFYG
jgi:hypothetical protein